MNNSKMDYYAENQRIASEVRSGYESKDSSDRNDRNDFFKLYCIFLIYNNLLFPLIINDIQKK
ncbi:MAG: hypothetical protein LBR36_07495 [Bacteroidales bacterium]|jgi:hypothetical protein|nr:hypothetical protein [Bacteroidales bacterium]